MSQIVTRISLGLFGAFLFFAGWVICFLDADLTVAPHFRNMLLSEIRLTAFMSIILGAMLISAAIFWQKFSMFSDTDYSYDVYGNEVAQSRGTSPDEKNGILLWGGLCLIAIGLLLTVASTKTLISMVTCVAGLAVLSKRD